MSLDQQVKALERKLNDIARIETKRAYSSAINKTATVITRDVARHVSQAKNTRQRDITSRIFYRRSTTRTPNGKLSFYTKPLSAIKVPFSKNRRGFRVAGKQVERSFFAQMPNQKRHHIYQRKGKARTPIRRVNLSISTEVNAVAIPMTEKAMKNIFPKKLQHELHARLKGYVTRRS